MKDLRNKFDTVMAQDSTETEEMKPVLTYEEELKLDNTQVSINDDDLSSDEDELTDDECFLERHRIQEAEEVKRYNIGMKDKKDTKKGYMTPK